MYIEMTNSEVQELRKFVKGVNDPALAHAFNNVFKGPSSRKMKGYVHPVSKKICIDVSEDLSLYVSKVLVKYSSTIGETVKSGARITNATKWISLLKNIRADLSKIFK